MRPQKLRLILASMTTVSMAIALFIIASHFGEHSLNAAARISGVYQLDPSITVNPLQECLSSSGKPENNTALHLSIHQSGIFLNASLSVQNATAEFVEHAIALAEKEKLTLAGRLHHQHLKLAGQLISPKVCLDGTRPAQVTQSDIRLEAELMDKKIVGLLYTPTSPQGLKIAGSRLESTVQAAPSQSH